MSHVSSSQRSIGTSCEPKCTVRERRGARARTKERMRLRLCVTSTAHVLRCSRLAAHDVDRPRCRSPRCASHRAVVTGSRRLVPRRPRAGFKAIRLRPRARRRRVRWGSATSAESFPRTRRPFRPLICAASFCVLAEERMSEGFRRRNQWRFDCFNFIMASSCTLADRYRLSLVVLYAR